MVSGTDINKMMGHFEDLFGDIEKRMNSLEAKQNNAETRLQKLETDAVECINRIRGEATEKQS